MQARLLFLVFFGAGMAFFPIAVFASEISELASNRAASDSLSKGGGDELETVDRLLCVDGLKVFLSSTSTSNGGVSIIQLYEERNGKVVPARCRSEKK